MQRAGAGTAESAPRANPYPTARRAKRQSARDETVENTRGTSAACLACVLRVGSLQSLCTLRESLLSAAQSLVSRLVWRGCALCVSACVSHRDVSRRVETRESRHESRERASQQRHRLPVKVCEILHLLKLLPPRPPRSRSPTPRPASREPHTRWLPLRRWQGCMTDRAS